MEIAEFTPILEQLIVRFRSWDQAQRQASGSAVSVLSAAERKALLDELESIVGGDSRPPPRSPWQVWADFLSTRSSSHAEVCAQRALALLRCYEQACELDLPFHVSSVLLRHHSIIKRSACESDGRLHMPTPPCGSSAARTSPPGSGAHLH